MTTLQQEALTALRVAAERVVLTRAGSRPHSRFARNVAPTPLAAAIRDRDWSIRRALDAGIPAETIADECGIAGTRRIRQIAGSDA